MIRSKNNGFTLIETMLAVAIIAMVMTPLFIAQSGLMRTISAITIEVQRIFALENFLYDSRQEVGEEQKFSTEKKAEQFQGTFFYKADVPDKQSSLKELDTLVIERATLEIGQGKEKRKETIISMQYKLKPPSKKS